MMFPKSWMALAGMACSGGMACTVVQAQDTLLVSHFLGEAAFSQEKALKRWRDGMFASFPMAGDGMALVRDLAAAQQASVHRRGGDPVVCYFEPPRGLGDQLLLDFLMPAVPGVEEDSWPHDAWSWAYDWGEPERVTPASHPRVHAQLGGEEAVGFYVVEQWYHTPGQGIQVRVRLAGKGVHFRMPDGEVGGMKNLCMTPLESREAGNGAPPVAAPKVHERTVDYLFSNDELICQSGYWDRAGSSCADYLPFQAMQPILLGLWADVSAGHLKSYLHATAKETGVACGSADLPQHVVREFERYDFDLNTGDRVGKVKVREPLQLADVVGLRVRERWEIQSEPFYVQKEIVSVTFLITGEGEDASEWVSLPVSFMADSKNQ